MLEEVQAGPCQVDRHAPAQRVEHDEALRVRLSSATNCAGVSTRYLPVAPELVGVGHRAVRVGQVVLGLPEPVGVHLVEEERRHALPTLLGVLGQRDDGGRTGRTRSRDRAVPALSTSSR